MTLERRKLRRSIPSLQNLDQDLFYDIKRIFVFGRDASAAFFITKSDHVYAYGVNSCGMLGLGPEWADRRIPEGDPAQVTALTARKIIQFAAGRDHVLALTKSGQIFACGSNRHGQLAIGDEQEGADDRITIPLPIESLRREKIIAIACGAFHSIALTSRGLVLAWGYNFWGQLGIGDNRDRREPTLIGALRRENIVEIACGQHHAVALSTRGDLFTWGHNAFGQLGIGEPKANYRNIPTKVIEHDRFRIRQVTCGQNHVLAVSIDGRLLGFGSNYYGQLGTGSRANQNAPVAICDDRRIRDIAASPFTNTSVARTKSKRNSLIFGKCGDHWLLSPLDDPPHDDRDYDDDKKNARNRESTDESKCAPKWPFRCRNKQRNNHSESFMRINAATPNTSVVRTNKNRFWFIFSFLRKAFLPAKASRNASSTN